MIFLVLSLTLSLKHRKIVEVQDANNHKFNTPWPLFYINVHIFTLTHVIRYRYLFHSRYNCDVHDSLLRNYIIGQSVMQTELNDLKWKMSCFADDHITSSFRQQTYVPPCQTVPVSCPISLLISLSKAGSGRSQSGSSGRASHHTILKTSPFMLLR